MLGILWKPWEWALFFPCTSFPCGKLSQQHSIILSASPSTASLDSELPSQHSTAGSCFLFGMLRTADVLCASLVHRRGQEREGFCRHQCSKACCTTPTEALPRGSQEKVNQRALLKKRGNWDTIASSRCRGKEAACSHLHWKNFSHSSLTSLDFSPPSSHVTAAVQTCLSERAESP